MTYHRTYRGAPRSGQHAWTVIEILVVLLILAIVMVIALPLYLSAVADSYKKDCRSNMQAVADAEKQYFLMAYDPSVSHLTREYMAVSTDADLTTLFTRVRRVAPTCPSGGVYRVILSGTTSAAESPGQSVPAGSFAVECLTSDTGAATGHGAFIPGNTN